jgi:cysteine desulfurase
MKSKIYFDYAATTPVDPEVFEAMKPYFSEKFGNPSSVHQFGQEAAKAVVWARQSLADFLGCQPAEVIFISGATEGNNSIIKGFGLSKKLAVKVGGKVHIITTKIEHECVLGAAEYLEKEGFAEVSFLPVNQDGLVEIKEIEKAIKPNTVLVSVMYANNEIGAIQPIIEIGKLLKELNQKRQNKIYFHTDAVQAINCLDCNVDKLGVDFLTLSGHKFYGPKGIGVMYVRQDSFFQKYMHGGEQEFKMRSGTHNTSGIVGLGKAIELVGKRKSDNEKIKKLRDKLIDGILKNIPGSALNGSRQDRLPNNANFRFKGVEGEAILIALDLEGIAISTGSACASKSLEPSHVLMSLGLEPLDAHSSVRFTLGRFSKEDDVDKVLKILPGIIEKLRGISGGVGERAKDKILKDLGC